jgi:hypothetical protein
MPPYDARTLVPEHLHHLVVVFTEPAIEEVDVDGES